MISPALIRTLGLFVPIGVTWSLWMWRRLRGQDRRAGAAALLASVWNLPALLLLHVLAARFGWWRFQASGGLFLGMPVDLYLGWALLWGAIPVLAFPRAHLALVAATMAGIDLILMPVSRPVVQLGSTWLVGEAVGLVLGLLPAQAFARWTRDGRRLAGRAALQVVAFSGLMLGVLPAAIIELTGGSWRPLLDRPTWQTAVGLQIMALPAILGLSALQEFVERGGGTPVPYDPPRRLVTSGVYAYLANPMQVAMSLMLIIWGVLLSSLWVAAAGLMGVIYSAGLAVRDEGGDLARRFGDAWPAYRRAVPRWIPRWRPWGGPAADTERRAPGSRLYLAETCAMCSEVARWFRARRSSNLTFVAAEDHPVKDLHRVTYDAGDGSPIDEGVAALARGLEHIHLGWAFVGWTIRLPLVRQLVQLMTDAVGGGPRLIARRAITEEKSG